MLTIRYALPLIKMIAMGTAVVSFPKNDLTVSYSMPLAD
jgi:hypothetical protein